VLLTDVRQLSIVTFDRSEITGGSYNTWVTVVRDRRMEIRVIMVVCCCFEAVLHAGCCRDTCVLWACHVQHR